ncbi:aldo/keto reductase [Leptolyngbya sp. 15MV]|nr:aldo/keto reductase [Leptolyngbya sp. 15MV]
MRVERTELAPGYSVSRLVRGGWQLAGGHGEVDRARAIADMRAFLDAGVTTFDCADIYTGVEALIGVDCDELDMRERMPERDPPALRAALAALRHLAWREQFGLGGPGGPIGHHDVKARGQPPLTPSARHVARRQCLGPRPGRQQRAADRLRDGQAHSA